MMVAGRALIQAADSMHIRATLSNSVWLEQTLTIRSTLGLKYRQYDLKQYTIVTEI